MKKIAVALLVCFSAVLCFSACTEIKTVVKDGDGGNVGGGALGVIEDNYVDSADENAGGAQNADELTDVVYQAFGYIEFGYYPQTIAEKDAVKQMSVTTDATGYYVSAYDDEHYAKIAPADVYAMFEDDYEFSDETIIKNRETYYFKVEPIKWRVFAQLDLSGNMRNIYLISDVILDSSAFLGEKDYAESPTDGNYYNNENGALANNWAYSELRRWLNNEFYKKAFSSLSEEDKAKLIERNVSEVCDDYDPEDATEKVFVLSYDQAEKLTKLNAVVSDYARCRGTWMSVFPEFYGNGRWWLSTAGDKTYRSCYVSDHNSISRSGESAGSTFMGVRPAIMLSVDDAFEILTEEEEK